MTRGQIILDDNSNEYIRELEKDFQGVIDYVETDSLTYRLACLYMGITELHDRLLTNKRSRWDSTEAYIDGATKSFSCKYAAEIRHKIMNEYQVPWYEIQKEITSHCKYNAQRWVDEYKRIWKIK